MSDQMPVPAPIRHPLESYVDDTVHNVLRAVSIYVNEEVDKLHHKLDRQDMTLLEAVRIYANEEDGAVLAKARAEAQAADLDILRSVQPATILASEMRADVLHQRAANRDSTSAWLTKVIDGDDLLDELEAL